MADGRERQVSGHQRLAVRRQLPQKTDPDAGRLLGVVFEAVVPVGVVEPDLEHGVAGERQPVAAGRQADHAMPGGVAAGALDDDPRRHLVLVLERPHLAVVLFQEPFARPPKRVREPRRHGDAGEIGRLPELGLGGRHVDPQVRTQPLFHPFGEQPATVVLRTVYRKTAALLPRQYLRTRRIYVTSALLFRDAVAPPLCPFNSHCTGTRAGAPLSLIKSTRNFAGLVPLAFRSTTWTSSGPSYNVCPGVSVTCCPSFSCITTEPSST